MKPPTTSAIVNKALQASVAPVLRDAGFAKVEARNGWRWLEKAVWVFNVRAVGAYFSSGTEWPPGSVCVWLGVYYTFMPADIEIAKDDSARLVPAEHLCHRRSHLDCRLDQSANTKRLPVELERRRTDIWWVDPDGGNADAVAADIAGALRAQGLPWYERQSDLAAVLREVESDRDCFVKFDLAALLAREIGDRERARKYASLAAAEGRRIGRRDDWEARYAM